MSKKEENVFPREVCAREKISEEKDARVKETFTKMYEYIKCTNPVVQ